MYDNWKRERLWKIRRSRETNKILNRYRYWVEEKGWKYIMKSHEKKGICRRYDEIAISNNM